MHENFNCLLEETFTEVHWQGGRKNVFNFITKCGRQHSQTESAKVILFNVLLLK